MTALGVALLIVGAVVVTTEAHVPTLGALGGPGVLLLAIGAVLAVSGLGGGLALGLLAALALGGVGAGVVGMSVHKGIAVRKRRVRAGPERLIGHVGVVRAWNEPTGSVALDGALWRARRSWPHDEDERPLALHQGDSVVVECLDGLTLAVRPAEDWELMR
jgi:membrane-bound serine protease (ClpP class)